MTLNFIIVIGAAACSAFAAAFLLLLASAGRLPVLGSGAETAASSDKSIYRRQMAELDRMEQQGLLDAAGAEEARRELARYILAAEKALRAEAAPVRPRRRAFAWFLSGAVLFIPLFCGAVYAWQGRPDMPQSPFAAFMARDPKMMNLPEKIVRLEVLSARNPRSSDYADELAALYLQARRFQDAANTYNKAIVLGGENASRLLGYALALAGFNDGIVDKSAEDAFRNVLRVDPQNLQAQLFLARGLLQGGKPEAARALLQEFLLKAPVNSPNRANLATAIAALKQNGAAAQQQRAGGGLTASQRQFIAAHLSGLEARLAQEPQNAQGWEMLLSAYLLLGDKAKALSALARALQALPPAQAQAVAAAAARHGLDAEQFAAPRAKAPLTQK